MKRIFNYFSSRYLPRWLVLLFDLLVLPFSYVFAFILRFNFNFQQAVSEMSILHLVIVVPVFLFSFRQTKSYSGILRHSTAKDVMRIITATSFSMGLLFILILIARHFNVMFFETLPFSVTIIMTMATAVIMVTFRLLVRLIFLDIGWNKRDTKKVMIFGAGKLGRLTFEALQADKSANIEMVGFIDDNPSLRNKYVSCVPVYSASKAFTEIIPKNKITEVIIAINQPNITQERKRKIVDSCLEQKVMVKEVPTVETWINGELQTKTIKKIKIEDLLGRDSIRLDRQKIEAGLKHSVVLVTGAAGSIGSEIVRQLIDFRVKQVILFDKAESALYDLQQEIIAKDTGTQFVAIVGDITNELKLRKVFRKYTPDIVFNAAAYKHVPLMEEFPSEALRVNVGGTKIIADLAIEYNVGKFVFISTDKAVNPTNVMGATKRASEIYIQSLAQSSECSTRFITTRFGNVLGSNGSVVPLFKKQIERGGPVTVTHKDITRYFMTIPEACQLVLEAGFLGQGGEIFVFDMGEPVRIFDLAKRMIALSGLSPDKDIQIKITQLRPGEKLYEELLDNKEELLPTYNKKIMIGKVRKHDYNKINWQIIALLNELDKKSNEQLVEELMRIVPEFVSMNSVYINKNRNKKVENELLSSY